MKFKIYSDGVEVNTIAATPAFVINYCTANGYTFARIEEPEPEPEPTETEQLRADVEFLAIMTGVTL